MCKSLTTFPTRSETEKQAEAIDRRICYLQDEIERLQLDLSRTTSIQEACHWELLNCAFPDDPEDDLSTCARCGGTGLDDRDGGLIASEADCGKCKGTGEAA